MTQPKQRAVSDSAPSVGSRPAGTSSDTQAARAVREMFTRIAPRYDLLNHLLSLNLDRVWRRRTARLLAATLAQPDSRALDLCCGTGDLTAELLRFSRGRVVGSDFSHTMLTRALRKCEALFVEADALQMPFASGQFDVITAAFGFRNLANYRRGLEEIYRLLAPGGRVAILEFNSVSRGLLAVLYRWYFHSILPRLGDPSQPMPEAARHPLKSLLCCSRILLEGLCERLLHKTALRKTALYKT